jgi:hypothetical protein
LRRLSLAELERQRIEECLADKKGNRHSRCCRTRNCSKNASPEA